MDLVGWGGGKAKAIIPGFIARWLLVTGCASFWLILVQPSAIAASTANEASVNVPVSATAVVEAPSLSATPVVQESFKPRIGPGRWGVGLNYPGLGLRTYVDKAWFIEVRGQYEKKAQAYGGRLYHYVLSGGRIYPYLGVGGAGIRYKGNGFIASGYLAEGFAGLEYFIFENFSLQFDFGAEYVGLGEGAVSVDGAMFAVNFGLMLNF